MDNLIQILLPLIIVILTFVLGSSRRRKAEQRNPQRRSEVESSPDSETALPPFMENFPFETESVQEVVETSEPDVPLVAEQSEPELPKEPEPDISLTEPPPVPVDSRAPRPTKPVPMTSLLELSPQTFRQGIILAEILGRPKAHRTRQS